MLAQSIGIKELLYDVFDIISEVRYNTGEGNASEMVYFYIYDSAGYIFSITDHLNYYAAFLNKIYIKL